jgi:hypothetical protein
MGEKMENRGGAASVAIACALALPVMYIFSLWPAVWLNEHGLLATWFLDAFCAPIIQLMQWSPSIRYIIHAYANLPFQRLPDVDF